MTVAAVIAGALFLIEQVRLDTVLRAEPAGLRLDTEFVPWGDVETAIVSPQHRSVEVTVRLAGDSQRLAGPSVQWEFAEPAAGRGGCGRGDAALLPR